MKLMYGGLNRLKDKIVDITNKQSNIEKEYEKFKG